MTTPRPSLLLPMKEFQPGLYASLTAKVQVVQKPIDQEVGIRRSNE